MIRRPPRSTRTYTLFPYTTLFRSLNFSNSYIDYTVDNKYRNNLKKLEEVINSIDGLTNSLSLEKNHSIKKKCNYKEIKFDENCLSDKYYLKNYIYFLLKESNIEQINFISRYADAKSLNDIGKYYFEVGEYDKSIKYLEKSYSLLSGKEKELVSFNLGVFYMTKNAKSDNTKAIKYFKETNFKESNFNIGVNYYIGLGIKEDDNLAYQYFKKASHMGLKRAKYNINQMNKLKKSYIK